MDVPPDEARSRSFATPVKRRRRFSIWSLLAPAAVIVLFVAFFSALGQSCLIKDCGNDDKSSKSGSEEAAEGSENKLPFRATSKVKSGDSLGSIAQRFNLTEDELRACNSTVDPQTLQPGTLLYVSAAKCSGADRAKPGANPDPLAGDTTVGADPAANATAAADPTANPGAN